MKKRILCVDAHPLVHAGLKSLLKKDRKLRMCGHVGSLWDALDAVPRLKPDLVVTGVALKGSSGINLLKNLKVHFPKLPVLFLSALEEELFAFQVIYHGAAGYITKDATSTEVLAAIRLTLHNNVYLSAKMQEYLCAIKRQNANYTGVPIVDLSDRELEVFSHLGQGYSSRQIIEEFNISPNTFKKYVERSRTKLALPTFNCLRALAFAWRY